MTRCWRWRCCWAPQSTGSGLPIGTAQGFHVFSPEKQPLEAHRPANALKLSPCGAAIREKEQEEETLEQPLDGRPRMRAKPF